MKKPLKYKLVKEYPSSPILGFHIEFCDGRNSWKVYNNHMFTDWSISNLKPEQYPEYWEPIIEETKVYKVLTWKDNYSTIESVLRLSDNVEFKVGETVTLKDEESFILERFDNDGDDSLQIITDFNSVVCYLEDINKVVEKDYEILSIKGNNNTTIYRLVNNIYSARVNGYNYYITSFPNGPHGCQIHSVKRLSDGEVFQIGDKFINNFNSLSIIHSFAIVGNTIDLQYYSEYRYGCPLKDAKKAKTPLFKTEDGVDIFEGDRFYWVNPNFDLQFKPRHGSQSSIPTTDDIKKGHKYFSTKEAAEEYILMHKPCLSINDILSIRATRDDGSLRVFGNELKQLVKSKL